MKKRFIDFTAGNEKETNFFSTERHTEEKIGSFMGIGIKLHLVVVKG